MVYGFKPQGINRSIQANTRNPPQDPPIPIEKPIIIIPKVIVKPIVKKIIVEKPKVIIEKVIATPKIIVKVTLKQKIISLLKKIMRR